MQVDKDRLAAAEVISERHARGNPLVQTEHIPEVRGHVAQKRQFRGTGVAENHGHSRFPQKFVNRFSYRAHSAPSSQRLCDVIPLPCRVASTARAYVESATPGCYCLFFENCGAWP